MKNPIREFLKLETASGILLAAMAILALILANSPLQHYYETFFNAPLEITFSNIRSSNSLSYWINEGLMAIFFFLIGLEVKREFFSGHLVSMSQRILPGIATLCGVMVPALIYLCLNAQDLIKIRGWAIPTATDIAFALAVLSIFGKSVPQSLRIFLLTIAVVDDIIAIIIIALFYSGELSYLFLCLSGLVLLVMVAINKIKVQSLSLYIILGLVLWFLVLQSGVHATVAGVCAAFTIPLKNDVEKLEQNLHPWVAYFILPLFALANAGLSFTDLNLSIISDSVTLGIFLGLFLGKQIGIFLGTWFPVKLGWAKLPKNTGWHHIYGVSILCGIGFTMSLFIGSLAFRDQALENYSILLKLGILAGSFISFLYGYFILRFCFSKKVIQAEK